ncbi:hypothetical protein [Moritella dasanensis]|uniref:hypothetical protein n=1 Tax=Moritella dasanensis TaxID=428031 RepID=UPI00192B6D19|nr:hypothetical protein [Moritella dasanensis]
MLSIPLPFVISIMLGLLALALYARSSKQARASCLFLGLCAATTTIVGLRWTFGLNILSAIQPILASAIPFAAWYTFTHTNQNNKGDLCKHFMRHFISQSA